MNEDSGGRPDAEERAAGADPHHNVTAMNFWDEVIADMEATAREYENEGWETLQLHPGDVTTLSGREADRFGLDVLIPDNEYETVEEWLAGGVDFDGYEVFRASEGSFVYALVVMEDSTSGRAVLFPVYYSMDDPATTGMLDRAREAGRMHSYLRRLKGPYVELTHADPELFAPDGG